MATGTTWIGDPWFLKTKDISEMTEDTDTDISEMDSTAGVTIAQMDGSGVTTWTAEES